MATHQVHESEIASGARAPHVEQTDTERRTFAGIEKVSARELAATSLAATAKAIIEARYIVAQGRRRDDDRVRQRLLRRCENPRFAEAATYTLPARGQGQPITGPSIRFVEAALKEMGNVVSESVPILDDAERRLIRVTVTDLETNTTFDRTIVLSKTVERRRVKEGQSVLARRTNSFGDLIYIVEASDDELATKEAAMTSKVMRSLGLRIVDGGLIDECEEMIGKTLNARAKADPDGERKRLIDSFYAMGVRVEDLKEFLGPSGSMERLSPADLQQLRQIYTALREGEASWAEIIEARRAVLGTAKPEGETGQKGPAGDRATALADKLRKNAPPTVAGAPQDGQQAPGGDNAPPNQAVAPEGDKAQTKATPSTQGKPKHEEGR